MDKCGAVWGVWYLAQGHKDMQVGGAGYLMFGVKPAQPSEQQLPKATATATLLLTRTAALFAAVFFH